MAAPSMFVQRITIASQPSAATARIMLSSLKPDDVSRAILQNNTRLLEGIKGIGKKTAERIVLELKDKVNKNDATNTNSSLIYNTLEQDALNALLGLGIGRQQAENALKKIAGTAENQNLEQLIKKALQSI